MIHVRTIMGDDIFGSWHVVEIIVDDNRQRHSFNPDDEAFPNQDEAEQDARARAQQFLQQKLGITNGDILWDVVASAEAIRNN